MYQCRATDMGEVLAERQSAIEELFVDYDFDCQGDLSVEQLQVIHADMRMGGISISQARASIDYACVGETCSLSELFDVLTEMDRRYYLLQDLRWEFSMLDINKSDTIPEQKAKWFAQTLHGKYFSNRQWDQFFRRRAIPSSGVSFAEIEVMLCNIPSRDEYLTDQKEQNKEEHEQAQHELEMQRVKKAEKGRQQRERGEAKKRKQVEDKKNREDEDRRRMEEEEERRLRAVDKEEAESLKKKLEDEEERGRKEAEGRENQNSLDAALLKETELEQQEATRLEELQRQEEEMRRKDQEEAEHAEQILQDAIKNEKKAEDEAKEHCKRKDNAKDDNTRKEAEDAESRARLKQKQFKGKRIKYNLKVTMKKRDRENLPPAVSEFKRAKMPDDDKDLERAERMLKEFKARDGLKQAMTSRQLNVLEQAISYVKKNGFEMQLSKDLLEANKILLQLRRLERIRAEILELKQSTVAEIRSYQKPPQIVHTVMTATLLLLGHKEKETKDWKTVQALVGKTGKEGLKRRCLECKPEQLKEVHANRAKDLLSKFELDDVRDVSAGAATFYLWSCTMIDELENTIEMKKAEVEEKKREREEIQRAREETKQKEKQPKEETVSQGTPSSSEQERELKGSEV